MRSVARLRLSLASRILAFQLAIMLGALVVGALVTVVVERAQLDLQFEQRALDVQTRSLMENELLSLWAATSASVVFVTHDLEEAIALADRVVVITAGPGTVKGTYSVDLPRPRNVAEIRFLPQFARIYEAIWMQLRDEVLVSYERQKHAAAAV